ncbi:MAG: TetR/AcrR family transcriptional regulator C-terminal domain-containing protein, partial [Hyphomonadaceae bacterium]
YAGTEQLLRALIEREISPLVARIEALASAGVDDPAATFRALAKLVSGVLGQARVFALPLLVVAIANRFPDLAEDYRQNVFARGRAAMEGLVKRGIAIGQFRNIDPAAGARAIMGPLMFEVIWTHALKGPSELGRSQAWVDAQVDVALNGLAAEKAA